MNCFFSLVCKLEFLPTGQQQFDFAKNYIDTAILFIMQQIACACLDIHTADIIGLTSMVFMTSHSCRVVHFLQWQVVQVRRVIISGTERVFPV